MELSFRRETPRVVRRRSALRRRQEGQSESPLTPDVTETVASSTMAPSSTNVFLSTELGESSSVLSASATQPSTQPSYLASTESSVAVISSSAQPSTTCGLPGQGLCGTEITATSAAPIVATTLVPPTVVPATNVPDSLADGPSLTALMVSVPVATLLLVLAVAAYVCKRKKDSRRKLFETESNYVRDAFALTATTPASRKAVDGGRGTDRAPKKGRQQSPRFSSPRRSPKRRRDSSQLSNLSAPAYAAARLRGPSPPTGQFQPVAADSEEADYEDSAAGHLRLPMAGRGMFNSGSGIWQKLEEQGENDDSGDEANGCYGRTIAGIPDDGKAEYMAIYPYQPQAEDEVPLSLGDLIVVGKVFDDGWATVYNMTTDYHGVAPMACLAQAEETTEDVFRDEARANDAAATGDPPGGGGSFFRSDGRPGTATDSEDLNAEALAGPRSPGWQEPRTSETYSVAERLSLPNLPEIDFKEPAPSTTKLPRLPLSTPAAADGVPSNAGRGGPVSRAAARLPSLIVTTDLPVAPLPIKTPVRKSSTRHHGGGEDWILKYRQNRQQGAPRRSAESPRASPGGTPNLGGIRESSPTSSFAASPLSAEYPGRAGE